MYLPTVIIVCIFITADYDAGLKIIRIHIVSRTIKLSETCGAEIHARVMRAACIGTLLHLFEETTKLYVMPTHIRRRGENEARENGYTSCSAEAKRDRYLAISGSL